jgi:hypothetical protein
MSMSKTTPDDLAVAFRSLVRRRSEAIHAAKGAPVGDLLAELDRLVASAAAVVGAESTPEAVAAAIKSRSTEDWDTDALDALRHQAIAAGSVLNRIAAAGPDED